MYARDSSFCQRKVYADIRGSSLDRRCQTTPGFSVLSAFSEALEIRPKLLYNII